MGLMSHASPWLLSAGLQPAVSLALLHLGCPCRVSVFSHMLAIVQPHAGFQASNACVVQHSTAQHSALQHSTACNSIA